MPDAPRQISSRRKSLVLGILGVTTPLMMALWCAVALAFSAPAAWMAVIVVADASVLLGLFGWPAGRTRAALALGFLAVCTAGALWLTAAGIVGRAFGLLPWESATRLGPALFAALAEGWATPASWAWLAGAALLGWWWNR